MRRSNVSRISRFASSMSSSLPVSFHQPSTMCGRTVEAAIDQVLDRVGDLELVAEARLDAVHRLEDLGTEHVDADEREVADRLLRLLDEPDDLAVRRAPRRRTSADRARASAGSARPASRARTRRTNCVMPLFSRLSPRYITNGSSPMKSRLILHGVREPARRVLLDVV